MLEQSNSLLPLYEGWENYQNQLIEVLEPLTQEQLSLSPAPQLRSIGQSATHIVGTRAGWLYFVLERRDERLPSFAEWNDPKQTALPASSLIEGLRVTWQVMQETLANWTIADLAELVKDIDDDGVEHIFTRQWVIWHLIEHDLHHGGELSFTLGMHGLAGISL